MQRAILRNIIGLALGGILWAGCAAGSVTTPTATLTTTPSLMPTATLTAAPTATSTVTPTPTAFPTFTPSPAVITEEPVATDTPTPGVTPPTVPPPSDGPALNVTASSTSIKVGDEVTINGKTRGMGIPLFTVTLGQGGRIKLLYSGSVTVESADGQFEFVSGTGGMNEMSLVLRALQPGAATIRIGVSGEVNMGSPQQPAFAWGYASGEVTITVEP